MKKVQPTFLEALSSFSVPIVIIPAEDKDDPPQQLKPIGTGPWQLVEVGARQLREAEALRRLQAEHATSSRRPASAATSRPASTR